jgi:uncharacterized protein (DUF1697 family)
MTATTYVALLRGINVGGHKKVAMADLRDLLTHLGFRDARSLLQSGNLVFRGDSRARALLERRLETEAAKRLALHTHFMVRTAKEWQSVWRPCCWALAGFGWTMPRASPLPARGCALRAGVLKDDGVRS